VGIVGGGRRPPLSLFRRGEFGQLLSHFEQNDPILTRKRPNMGYFIQRGRRPPSCFLTPTIPTSLFPRKVIYIIDPENGPIDPNDPRLRETGFGLKKAHETGKVLFGHCGVIACRGNWRLPREQHRSPQHPTPNTNKPNKPTMWRGVCERVVVSTCVGPHVCHLLYLFARMKSGIVSFALFFRCSSPNLVIQSFVSVSSHHPHASRSSI